MERDKYLEHRQVEKWMREKSWGGAGSEGVGQSRMQASQRRRVEAGRPVGRLPCSLERAVLQG